jgi:hypothetical protein
MNIAIDFDDTYTADPHLWEGFKSLAESMGHHVFCVTKRGKDNKGIIQIPGWDIYHTNRMAKGQYCQEKGIAVHVWVDDSPSNIYLGG